jgi:hypothetical protein
MFGKPEWFKLSTCCQGVSPVSFRGWLHVAAWGALIVLPTVGLALAGKSRPEALIWLAASIVGFLWEMRGIRRQLQIAHERSLYFIGGEEHQPSEVATRNFDLKLRG